MNKTVDVKIVEKDFSPDTKVGQFQFKVSKPDGTVVFDYSANEEDLIDNWTDGVFTVAVPYPDAGDYVHEAWRKDVAGSVLVSLDGVQAYVKQVLTITAAKIAVPVSISFSSPA